MLKYVKFNQINRFKHPAMLPELKFTSFVPLSYFKKIHHSNRYRIGTEPKNPRPKHNEYSFKFKIKVLIKFQMKIRCRLIIESSKLQFDLKEIKLKSRMAALAESMMNRHFRWPEASDDGCNAILSFGRC